MGGADDEEGGEWEALYLRLPLHNTTWNSTPDWDQGLWNVTVVRIKS